MTTSSINTDHYRYQVTWSAADGEYVGLVDEFPSLSWLDEDQAEAFTGIRRLVAEVVEDMEQSGETPPTPKADRTFNGKFLVRTSPFVHGELIRLAEHRKVSLNGLVSSFLQLATEHPDVLEARIEDAPIGSATGNPLEQPPERPHAARKTKSRTGS